MKDLKEKCMEELAREFGIVLVERIIENIDYCSRENLEYELSIIKESGYFLTICFSTYAYSRVYEIFMKRKMVFREAFVGRNECEKALKLMDIARKKQKEKQQALQSSLHKKYII